MILVPWQKNSRHPMDAGYFVPRKKRGVFYILARCFAAFKEKMRDFSISAQRMKGHTFCLPILEYLRLDGQKAHD